MTIFGQAPIRNLPLVGIAATLALLVCGDLLLAPGISGAVTRAGRLWHTGLLVLNCCLVPWLPFLLSQLQRERAKRRRAEEEMHCQAEQLRDATEDLKKVAHMVSHDLRAPLINIKGYACELDAALKDALPFVEHFLAGVESKEGARVRCALHQDVPEALGYIDASVHRIDALIGKVVQHCRRGGGAGAEPS